MFLFRIMVVPHICVLQNTTHMYAKDHSVSIIASEEVHKIYQAKMD